MDRGRQFHFSQPVVCDRGRDLTKPWYVSVEWAWEGETVQRERVYSGARLGVVGRGNRADTLKERREYFARLAEVLVGMMRRGDNPFAPVELTEIPLKIPEGLALALAEKARRVDVPTQRVLNYMVRKVCAHWPKGTAVKAVTVAEVRDFLNAQNGNNNTYNNNRRDLHSLWNMMIELGIAAENPVSKVPKRSSKPTANEAYSVEQLGQVFAAMEAKGRNLHICARLMFHAFLRPHKEVRLLQRKHIDFERGTVSVPAVLRKAGDVFTLPLQPELRAVLERWQVPDLSPNDYIIHATDPAQPVAEYYFRVLWTRIKHELLSAGTVRPEQTLYSVRHTAACLYYLKTKDIEELQRVMGHKDLETTLIYLRSLGIYTKPIEVGNLPAL